MKVWPRPPLQILALLVALFLLVGGFIILRLSRQINLVGFISLGGEVEIRLPEGFRVDVFAENLDEPRFIHFGPDGFLYVAERGAGRIVRLPDFDGDGRSDGREIFADGLDAPHSLTFHQESWYIGVPTGVVKLQDGDGDGRAEIRETMIDDFPTGGHNTRTVLFLGDGRMLVSIGSSCNVCLEQDPRRAAILSYLKANAEQEEIFASGLRNAVGMAIQPTTGELWATNNGRDFLGDDQPPDALIRVREGADYGWPRCHPGGIIDPEFGYQGACDTVPAAELDIQAHSAPLGLVFYDAEQFPGQYRGDLFIAYHGSWNRSVPTGYKVVRVPFEDGQISGEAEDFAVGWLSPQGNQVSGRPVGLAVGPEGSLYVSDDSGGLIYRISYEGASP